MLEWCVVLKNAATQTQGIFRKHICFWTETIGFTCEYSLTDTKTKETLKNRRKKKKQRHKAGLQWHVCSGLVLITRPTVLMVWHWWVVFHSSLRGVQSERGQRDCCLFIHTAGNGSEQAARTKPQTLEHSSTLCRYGGLPINTLLSVTQAYTRCRVYRVSGHPVKKDIQFVPLVVVVKWGTFNSNPTFSSK